jgi:hypothetical protein
MTPVKPFIINIADQASCSPNRELPKGEQKAITA